jgi:hypothetical protein
MAQYGRAQQRSGWDEQLTMVRLACGCDWPRLTIPQLAALLIPLVTFPMVYYIVTYSPRYRIPLDWVFYILAGAALWRGFKNCAKWLGVE